MNRAEYLDLHAEYCARMMGITKAKNVDYCGDGDNPFANFSRVEAMGITDTMRGFLVRMSDKLSRLTSFAQKGEYSVSDESFEDTCLDLANYCLLLAAYQKSKKKPKDVLVDLMSVGDTHEWGCECPDCIFWSMGPDQKAGKTAKKRPANKGAK